MTKSDRNDLFPIDKKIVDQSIESAYKATPSPPKGTVEMIEAVLYRTLLDLLLDDRHWEDPRRVQFAVEELTRVCACWQEVEALTQSCPWDDPVSPGPPHEVPLDPKILWESEELRGRDPVEEMLWKKATEEMLERCNFPRKSSITGTPTDYGEECCDLAEPADSIETQDASSES